MFFKPVDWCTDFVAMCSFCLFMFWTNRSWKVGGENAVEIVRRRGVAVGASLDRHLPLFIIAPFRMSLAAYKAVQKRFPGFLFGMLVFVAYYQSFAVSRQVLNYVSQMCHNVTAFLPDNTVQIVCSFIPFGLLSHEFSRVPSHVVLVMYAFVAALFYSFDFHWLVFFFITWNLTVQITYGQSSKWMQWFFTALVAVYCTKAVSYHFDIASPIGIIAMVCAFGILYVKGTDWVHEETGNGPNVHDGSQERYFQRGSAQAQMQFIKQRLKVFLFIIAIAVLSTFGQVRTWSALDFETDTSSNVFCKAENRTQLECLVNVSYYNPFAPDADNCSSVGHQWDFCGECGGRNFNKSFPLIYRIITTHTIGSWHAKLGQDGSELSRVPAPGDTQTIDVP